MPHRVQRPISGGILAQTDFCVQQVKCVEQEIEEQLEGWMGEARGCEIEIRQRTSDGAKAAQGDGFVRLHVKDSKEPRDLKKVMHALGKIQKLQLPASAADSSERRHELANSGAIDIVDVTEIKKNFAMARVDPFANHLAEHCAAFAKRYLATEIDNRDIEYFAARSLKSHGYLGGIF
jgi:hypothetical protein